MNTEQTELMQSGGRLEKRLRAKLDASNKSVDILERRLREMRQARDKAQAAAASELGSLHDKLFKTEQQRDEARAERDRTLENFKALYDAATEAEQQRDEAKAALEAHSERCAVIVGDCQHERDAAQAAAARWKKLARFWRRLASWMFPEFYEHVTQSGEYRQFTFRRYATNARRAMSKAKLS